MLEADLTGPRFSSKLKLIRESGRARCLDQGMFLIGFDGEVAESKGC